MKQHLLVAACILALAASALVLVAPSGKEDWAIQHQRMTRVDLSGSRAIALLALPVLVTLLPLGIQRHVVRVGAAVLLFGLVVVAGLSIGLFYLPAAIAEAIGAGLYFDS